MNKLLCVVVLCALIISFSATAQAVQYRITDLGVLVEGKTSCARCINNNGQIAGYAISSDYRQHACLWSNGDITDLGTPGCTSAALDINDNGQMVGYLRWLNFNACSWQNGTTTQIGNFSSLSIAYGINNSGQIVGWLGGYIWKNGYVTQTDIMFTSAINDNGEIVGFDSNGVLIWQNGNTTNLGALGGNSSYPNDINNDRQIVGYAEKSSGGYTAYMWDAGNLTDLGTFGGSAQASAINNNGQIVGYSNTAPDDSISHAFIWQNGVMQDLGTLVDGGTSAAYGINDHGQIVGYATAVDGMSHAVLWTPVPEPSSILVLLCGIGSLVGVAMRRRI